MSTNKLLLVVVVLFLHTYNWFVKAQKPFLELFCVFQKKLYLCEKINIIFIMKIKYFIFASILIMSASCRQRIGIERLNINNPVNCVVDSVQFSYYLTTTDYELTTTLRHKEGLVVHYDFSNISTTHKTLAHDYVHPYIQGLHGICYMKDGAKVPSMSFNADRSLVYLGENDLFEIGTFELSPQATIQFERHLSVDVFPGEYYYETTPILRIYENYINGIPVDTITYNDITPLRVYFVVK